MTVEQKSKICSLSGRIFQCSSTDRAFYSRMGVPVPTLCPAERARRRLAWRNERVLYKRSCAKTQKPIVSIHSTQKPYPVWDNAAWWSDDWDAHSFGQEFDFSRPFFDQFIELYSRVPQQAAQHSKSENCDYTNQSQCNRDCYLVVASNYSRDCLYGMWFQHCEDCVDCLYLEKGQLCYEVLNGSNCYGCTFSQNLDNCSEVHFCNDCIGCSHCFACVNLRNKQYCFFNQQLSRNDYQNALASFRLDTHSGVTNAHALFQKHVLKCPHKYYIGRMIERSTGDYLQETRDALDCYNCRHCERISYCRDAWRARNCYDLVETLENDFCIELEGCWDNVDCGFSMKLNQTHNVWYSSHCFSSSDLMGCVGLRHSQYAILNRRYSKDDYHALRAQIVQHMQKTGEWGEFFPINLSFFGYNETVAQEYFPLTEDSALSKNFKWHPEAYNSVAAGHYAVPESIIDVNNDIVNVILKCQDSATPYRITTAELNFYRKIKVPIPLSCPAVRHLKRMRRRNPRELYQRNCHICASSLQSTYAPDRLEQVLCETCYLRNI